jgi:pimeloyl-ACP methyl ester carboxylesterase
MPPARTVLVPGRGEFFLRDSGGDGPPVLLVHGWMFPSDLNWAQTYGPLQKAGYRVLAMDLRGHGRGLRSSAAFRLVDCADDAAGVLGQLGVAPALVVGYSMGGPVAQLLARRHPERVAGIVLCATRSTGATRATRPSGARWAACGCCSARSRRGRGRRACGWRARRRRAAAGWLASCRAAARATWPRPAVSWAGSTAASGWASWSRPPPCW